MSEDLWAALKDDLGRLHRAERRVRFWLRDDDAVRATPALDRLLSLTARSNVPLLLAIIPKHADPSLQDALAASPLVSPCQHGFSHRNYAAAGERAQELGLQRPIETVLAELGDGRRLLQRLLGDALTDTLVPPWNRMDDRLLPQLGHLGFAALSRFGAPVISARDGIAIVNSTLDIINWKNGKRGREPDDLIARIRSQIAASEDEPVIGVLTHHLDHDETAWDFLERLMASTANGSGAEWVAFSTLAARLEPSAQKV